MFQAYGVILVEGAFLAVSGTWTYVVFTVGGDTIFALSTAIGGPILGIALPVFIDGINPVKQMNQAYVLRKKVINDEDIEVRNIHAVIERIDLVLSKIN